MKYILRRIKNLVPYILVISTYFFFINIEAQRNTKKVIPEKSNIKKENNTKTKNSNIIENNRRAK